MNDLVSRIRDVETGTNTLMTLDELSKLGLDIVVFRDDVPSELGYHKFFNQSSSHAPSVIDTKWLDGHSLDQPDDDAFRSQLEDMHRREKESKRDSSDSWRFEWDDRARKGIEYASFRPSVLAERVRNADLVVLPESLIGKVSTEVPEANIALLEDARHTQAPLRTDVNTERNYPRVLVRGLEHFERFYEEFRELSFGASDIPRIDDETINLLFKRRAERVPTRWSFDFEDRRAYNPLDIWFYEALGNSPTNPTKRTTKPIIYRFKRDSRGWSLMGGWDEVEIDTPMNYYGMGRAQHGYRAKKNNFLEDLRKSKQVRIREMYAHLWTQPLDSIDEILDRQVLLRDLIDDNGHRTNIERLVSGLNSAYEPYLHITNMAKLISTNTLRSRWGASIHKQSFYDDFTRIAKEFIGRYEAVKDALSGINPTSREMQVLLAPLQTMIADEGTLNQTYAFLRRATNDSVRNFSDLQEIFKTALKSSGASKLEELEEYDAEKDPDPHARVVRTGENSFSLKGYKSPYLKHLTKRFHSQNPVSQSDAMMEYADYVGSKLVAYLGQAEFIREKGWTRPDIAAGEEGIVEIRNGWYPLLESQHSDRAVRNDTLLDSNDRIEIIDGTNIGGKTVDTRKTMFIVAAALAGSYVPAEYARISFFDRVRFRLKQTGMYETSALVEELDNIADPLRALGAPILVGFDETFTSTNYREGDALTYGLVKRLAQDPLARAIFTSHYPELPELLEDQDVNGVKFSHFEFRRTDHQLEFPHRKLDGHNPIGDYALAIARNEKIPEPIIAYAERYMGIDLRDASQLEQLTQWNYKSTPKPPTTSGNGQVLDPQTRQILFGKRRGRGFFGGDFDLRDLLLLQSNSIDDYTKNPITNIDEINERLDVIGELVEDEQLRKKYELVVTSLGINYKKSFYEPLAEFLAASDRSDFAQERCTKQLRSVIGGIASVVRELPKDLGKAKFKTKTLTDIASSYSSIMAQTEGSGGAFFKYIVELDDRITEMEPQEEEEQGIFGRPTISYEQLKSIIDVDSLQSFQETLASFSEFWDKAHAFYLLAEEAVSKGYSRPEIAPKEENCLIIRNGKYELGGNAVANDTNFNGETLVEVVEGVNAGGKTFDTKKALYIAIRALSGSWVPAEYAKVSIRDKIILREKGTGDAVSAFQQDCQSVKEATPPDGQYWLIGMDETFTSTERRGGAALTYGLIRSVIDQGNSLLIMPSHYPDLKAAFTNVNGVQFSHFPFERVRSEDGKQELKFPYTKSNGPMQDYRYAIAVATNRGFDNKVIEFAQQRMEAKGF